MKGSRLCCLDPKKMNPLLLEMTLAYMITMTLQAREIWTQMRWTKKWWTSIPNKFKWAGKSQMANKWTNKRLNHSREPSGVSGSVSPPRESPAKSQRPLRLIKWKKTATIKVMRRTKVTTNKQLKMKMPNKTKGILHCRWRSLRLTKSSSLR